MENRLLTVYIQLKLRKMISTFCSRPPYNAALATAEKCIKKINGVQRSVHVLLNIVVVVFVTVDTTVLIVYYNRLSRNNFCTHPGNGQRQIPKWIKSN